MQLILRPEVAPVKQRKIGDPTSNMVHIQLIYLGSLHSIAIDNRSGGPFMEDEGNRSNSCTEMHSNSTQTTLGIHSSSKKKTKAKVSEIGRSNGKNE
jgi:hypothetical protein